MAPRTRIAHTSKYQTVPRKIKDTTYEKTIKAEAKSFICTEAKEVKLKTAYRAHSTSATPVNASNLKKLRPSDKYAYRPSFLRTFESRPRILPEKIEAKIESLLQLLKKPAKKRPNKPKILPIKGIHGYSKHVNFYTPINKGSHQRY